MTVFSQVSTSLLSETFSTLDEKTFTRRLEKNFRININAAVLLASILILTKTQIFSIYGVSFKFGADLLNYTISAAVIGVGQFCIVQFYIGTGKMWYGFLCQLIWVGFYLGVLLSGWGDYSALAMARSLLIANCAAFLSQLIFSIHLNKSINKTEFSFIILSTTAFLAGCIIKINAAIFFSIVAALIFLFRDLKHYFPRRA